MAPFPRYYALILAITAIGSAAQQDINKDLVRPAVIFLQQSRFVAGRVLKIDPVVYERGSGWMPSLSTAGARHDSAFLAVLNIAGVAEVVTSERARQCAGNAPLDCMTNGVSLVASIGRAVIKGDTATIDVMLQGSQHVSAADSAEKVKGPGGILSVRMSRAYGSIGYLRAVREGNAWVLKEFKLLAQS